MELEVVAATIQLADPAKEAEARDLAVRAVSSPLALAVADAILGPASGDTTKEEEA